MSEYKEENPRRRLSTTIPGQGGPVGLHPSTGQGGPAGLHHQHDLEDNIWGPSDYNFLTAQMSAKRGLHQFGQRGVDALMKELQQLIDRRVMRPRDARTLSQGEKKSALMYLCF